MRHKYETRGIVLSRTPAGETNALITFLTPELGLVQARAQGVRRSGAKLAAALATFAESSIVLVRGREGWRVTGAVLEKNWFEHMQHAHSRVRAARVSGLLLRLVAGEEQEHSLFPIIGGFFNALSEHPEEKHEAIEMLAALRTLTILGLDTGELPGKIDSFASSLLSEVQRERVSYIARINRGITASGL